MGSVDVSIYYDQHRVDAMERILHSQGRKLSEEIEKQMDALYQVDVHSAPEVNRNLCVGCGACVRRCAKQALRVIEG